MDLIKILGYATLCFIASYLMCAFYSTSFNIAYWTDTCRFMCMLMGGVGGVFCVLAVKMP